MNDITLSQAKDLVGSAAIDSSRAARIWCIAPGQRAVADFATALSMPKKYFRWLENPDQLKGTRGEIVIILPNWWMAGSRYSGMEQMLNDVQANVKVFYSGPAHLRPRWKGSEHYFPKPDQQ